jgi:hypothetical protein
MKNLIKNLIILINYEIRNLIKKDYKIRKKSQDLKKNGIIEEMDIDKKLIQVLMGLWEGLVIYIKLILIFRLD